MARSRPSLLDPWTLSWSKNRLLWLVRCLVLALAGTTTVAASAQEKIVLTEELEVRGMDCVPQVTEVETRRPIPIICQTDGEPAAVELRYRFEGAGKKWEKLELQKGDKGWIGTIPCSATPRVGNLKVYVFARNEARKVIGRIGRNTAPMNIKLVESSKLPPPSLPNSEPPDRCFSKTECPPEMVGTAACPGTKAAKAVKGAWGAGCSESGQCQDGLECVAGSCESPPKCEKNEDCPSGGECADGTCHYPTEEELADRLGPPKMHWVGLHFGVDFAFLRDATGVCGGTTEDSKNYACYRGGNVYTGLPNDANSGLVGGGPRLATLRALMSYDLAFKRFLFGARAGWAFRGSPKDFSPFHIELRALYSIRQGPENNRFRPYLGLAGGYAQVDTPVTTKVLDCSAATDPDDATMMTPDVAGCVAARTPADLAAYRVNGALDRTFDAYHQGGTIFFGPTLSTWFMLSNESAIIFNMNLMLPGVVFQPSLGYAMGI